MLRLVVVFRFTRIRSTWRPSQIETRPLKLGLWVGRQHLSYTNWGLYPIRFSIHPNLYVSDVYPSVILIQIQSQKISLKNAWYLIFRYHKFSIHVWYVLCWKKGARVYVSKKKTVRYMEDTHGDTWTDTSNFKLRYQALVDSILRWYWADIKLWSLKKIQIIFGF